RRRNRGADRDGDVAARPCTATADRDPCKGPIMTSPTPPEDPALLVHAYVDGELDPANALALERRMASDPALAAERTRIEALRAVLKQRLPREAPPPGLRARIEAAIGPKAPRVQPSWRALAASVALAAIV